MPVGASQLFSETAASEQQHNSASDRPPAQSHHQEPPSSNHNQHVHATGNILVSEPMEPMRSLKEAPLHQVVRDYLRLEGVNELSEFDWYAWPAILRGRHLYAMPESRDSTHLNGAGRVGEGEGGGGQQGSYSLFNSLSYLCPLLSLVLDETTAVRPENAVAERQQGQQHFGYVKKSMFRQAQNGPVLLIVCASGARAQQIIEIVKRVGEIALTCAGGMASERFSVRQPKSSRAPLRSLLIQGGGKEHQYDVPLLNGVCAKLYIALFLIFFSFSSFLTFARIMNPDVCENLFKEL